MAVIRKRRRAFVAHAGLVREVYTGAVYHDALTDVRWCEDVVGSYETANYFYTDQYSFVSPGFLDGRVTAFPVLSFEGWPYGNQNQGGFGIPHADASTTPPTYSDVVTRVAANTNPSKPAVSVPVFLAQLKDLPRSLQRAGLLKKKQAASKREGDSSVDFNFGWDLLYKDLQKIFDFTAQVDQRVKQLTAAYGVKGSRGRGVAWSDYSRRDWGSLALWTVDVSVYANPRVTDTNRRIWGSVHWTADHIDAPSATEILQRSRLIVHGWRLAPADVWELIPWSWFVDYFINVGDYLEATGNNLGIHVERSCVMEETISYTRDLNISVSNPGVTATPAVIKRTTKERTPWSPSLTLHSVPFLGPKQLVTLSSIVNGWKWNSFH
jgi:hypothetical protein